MALCICTLRFLFLRGEDEIISTTAEKRRKGFLPVQEVFTNSKKCAPSEGARQPGGGALEDDARRDEDHRAERPAAPRHEGRRRRRKGLLVARVALAPDDRRGQEAEKGGNAESPGKVQGT